MAADQHAEILQAEPGHFESSLHRELTERFQEESLARAARTTDHHVLASTDPLERAQRQLCWCGDR